MNKSKLEKKSTINFRIFSKEDAIPFLDKKIKITFRDKSTKICYLIAWADSFYEPIIVTNDLMDVQSIDNMYVVKMEIVKK